VGGLFSAHSARQDAVETESLAKRLAVEIATTAGIWVQALVEPVIAAWQATHPSVGGHRGQVAGMVRLVLAVREAEGADKLPEPVLRDLPTHGDAVRLVLLRGPACWNMEAQAQVFQVVEGLVVLDRLHEGPCPAGQWQPESVRASESAGWSRWRSSWRGG